MNTSEVLFLYLLGFHNSIACPSCRKAAAALIFQDLWRFSFWDRELVCAPSYCDVLATFLTHQTGLLLAAVLWRQWDLECLCKDGEGKERMRPKLLFLFFLHPFLPPSLIWMDLALRPFGNLRWGATKILTQHSLLGPVWEETRRCMSCHCGLQCKQEDPRGREVWSPPKLRWRRGSNSAIWISETKCWGSLWIGLDRKIAKLAKFCDDSLPSTDRATELSLFGRRATGQ